MRMMTMTMMLMVRDGYCCDIIATAVVVCDGDAVHGELRATAVVVCC